MSGTPVQSTARPRHHRRHGDQNRRALATIVWLCLGVAVTVLVAVAATSGKFANLFTTDFVP